MMLSLAENKSHEKAVSRTSLCDECVLIHGETDQRNDSLSRLAQYDCCMFGFRVVVVPDWIPYFCVSFVCLFSLKK